MFVITLRGKGPSTGHRDEITFLKSEKNENKIKKINKWNQVKGP